jgi:lysyl-tRNA synthetase class 2
MKFTEKLLRKLFKNVNGSLRHEYRGKKVDFQKEFEKIEFKDLLQKYTGINYEDYNLEALKRKTEDLGVEISKKVYNRAEVADALYKKLCLPKIEKPTFVIHHPSEMLPLAKPLEDREEFAASFQLVVVGWELVKGYSELNDPVLQKKFFKAQQELRKKGNEEAQFMDEDFIEALEYGMPPTLGFGMGIDRLAAFMTGAHSLREIILFPTMKPK